MDASKPVVKMCFTGKEIGLTSSMAQLKIQLYDFSSDEINVTATEVSSKYAQVEFNDLIKLLLIYEGYFLIAIILLLGTSTTLLAQSNKLIKELESKRGALQNR